MLIRRLSNEVLTDVTKLVWLGLDRNNDDATWKWADGSIADPDEIFWYREAPNRCTDDSAFMYNTDDLYLSADNCNADIRSDVYALCELSSGPC